MSDLKEMLKVIESYSQQGNRRALTQHLRQVIQHRRTYYLQSITENLQEEYADALYKTLLLELDEEEEDSIELAELAYLSLSSIIYTTHSSLEHYKRRILLLHYFCDFYTDSIIEIFLKQFRESNRLQARALAIECLEKMQLADFAYLEEQEPSFIDQNEELVDACNNIETDPHLSSEEWANAKQMHQILYTYLKVKYK